MSSGVITCQRILMGPQELLSRTMICRKIWEAFVERKRNGLTEQMRQQLWEELVAMKKLITLVIPGEPVKVEEGAIVYDPSRMEENRIYAVELPGRLHLLRKTKENIVETFELEPIE